MEVKEIQARLEIIKLAITIGDHSTILSQADILRELNSSKLNEIISLLSGKNYRQALYLIKNYLSEMGAVSSYEILDFEDEGERVLDVEDMLRMSPLAKNSIKDYKRSIYTDDDLESFAKNIEKSTNKEYKEAFDTSKPKESSTFMEDIEEEAKENIKAKAQIATDDSIDKEREEELNRAIDRANVDTPLDEISAEVLEEKSRGEDRGETLSKYKTLREKFAKKEPKSESKELKSSNVAKTILDKIKKQSNLEATNESKDLIKDTTEDKEAKNNSLHIEPEIKEKESQESEDKLTIEKDEKDKRVEKVEKDEPKLPKENKIEDKKRDNEIIYSPIPYIEQKFRQAFALYPPIKESDIWVEEVVKFLKYVSNNSFTEIDVKILLDEYNFFVEKNDIAKASQVLLLASSTDSKYAKFILARELFSGKILVRDLKNSFELMKSLANEFYPDAVCDLAQFYEYGIGVPKDKAIAIKLYEKAFQLGVTRATKHINRLKESSRFLSSIFKMK